MVCIQVEKVAVLSFSIEAFNMQFTLQRLLNAWTTYLYSVVIFVAMPTVKDSVNNFFFTYRINWLLDLKSFLNNLIRYSNKLASVCKLHAFYLLHVDILILVIPQCKSHLRFKKNLIQNTLITTGLMICIFMLMSYKSKYWKTGSYLLILQ